MTTYLIIWLVVSLSLANKRKNTMSVSHMIENIAHEN